MTAPPPVRLHTARFTLRPLVRSDAAALLPAFSDERTMRWWSRGPFTDEQALADYLVPPQGWAGGRSWVVVEGETGPALARLAAIDQGDGVSEIAFLVTPERQGEGIGRETMSALIGHLFTVENVRRVYADVDPDNDASNRLCRRLGFTLEGRLREAWRTHIGTRDSLIWGLLAREWPNSSAGLDSP